MSRERLVLLLDDMSHEGIVSPLKASGRSYLHKRLLSSAENWQAIMGVFAENDVRLVLSKMTAPVIKTFAHPEFARVRDHLADTLLQVPNAIFVFEDILSGEAMRNAKPFDWSDFRRGSSVEITQEDVPRLTEGLDYLRAKGFTLLPYRTRAEITLAAQAYLEDAEKGLLFRLYVPNGRLWQAEIDRLLVLFRDYLGRLGNSSVRLDQTRTDRGVIYAFHTDEGLLAGQKISTQFEEFSKLLDLCVRDPAAAEALLRNTSVAPREVIEIVERYSKEARRLQLDMRHDRERKILSIRHRLESELTDVAGSAVDDLPITQLVNAIVPPPESLRLAEQIDQLPIAAPLGVQINVNQQIIHRVEGIVAQEIRGNVHLTEEDERLFALFNAYGGESAPELASSLHELNDDSAVKARRVTAGQKIKGFLLGAASAAKDVGVGILQSYIEKKMLGL